MPRFDCYGRFVLDLEHVDGGWRALEVSLSEGKRRVRDDIVVPAELPASDLARWLDDLLHELGGPDREIRPLD